MIKVRAGEVAQALEVLSRCAEGPIFLQSNLLNFGLADNRRERRSVHLWRTPDWRGLIGLTASGVLMPQMRLAEEGDWATVRATLQGHSIAGMNGEAGQVARLRDVLGLRGAAVSLDREEPCFALDLSALEMPDVTGFELRPVTSADRALLIDWRIAYRLEILGDGTDEAALNAPREIDDWLRDGSHRLLWRDGHAVSVAGINARLPGLVQIGGVYTPAALRRTGLARRAVAMLLAELRERKGVDHAFLFAASEQAARAYTAIGFRPAGRMRIVVHATPREVAA